MKKIFALLVACLCILSPNAQTYTVKTVPNDHLKDKTDYVTNPDGIISAAAEQQINALIASVEDTASAEIAVVLLPSIDSDDIDDFATRLFMDWGIGKRPKDNGLLFLLVYDQREMVFRTGYGLEGVLPDAILSRVIRNDISPLLKKGDFDAGITAGIAKVCELLKNPTAVQEIMQQQKIDKQRKARKMLIYYLGVSLVFFIAMLVPLFSTLRSNRTNYKKYSDLNAFKGLVVVLMIFLPATMLLYGLFYFILKHRMRNKPIACNRCGNKMHKLSEAEEDLYLSSAQQAEETLKSKDYDVWLCDHCHNREIFPYDKFSIYTTCPYCRAKTYKLIDDRVVRQATTISSGQGQKTYVCKHCGKKNVLAYTIPMIILTATGGRGGGGGSFGGGGSWGGGFTGGGGARGGW